MAFAAVGDERADEFVAVVDVDQLADLEDADAGAGVAAGDDDRETVVADDAAAVNLAQDRVRRVARGVSLASAGVSSPRGLAACRPGR